MLLAAPLSITLGLLTQQIITLLEEVFHFCSLHKALAVEYVPVAHYISHAVIITLYAACSTTKSLLISLQLLVSTTAAYPGELL